MKEVYQNEGNENVVEDMLESIAREGARRMLAASMEEEVNKFMGRERYERSEEFRGYRNGYHRSRQITVGVSAVEVKVPRVRDVPAEVSPVGFESKIVRRYERTSRQTQDLFRKLYLEGLSTGDFEPVFREIVGETAALSPNAIVRLKQRWEDENGVWRSRMLAEHRYAYIWADGVYLGGRSGQGEDCVAMCSGSEGGRGEGASRYGVGLSREHRELGRCAEEPAGQGYERSLAGGGRWRPGVVVGAR